MKWLNQTEFWEYFEHTDDPGLRIDYVGWCFFKISLQVLVSKIGEIEPNQDLRGEDDPPGPVSMWYGDLNGVPVLLDFHHQSPNGESVSIRHGNQLGSRQAIRNYFANWGNGWRESS